jgi:methylmalonyl-CoA mutase
MTNLQTLDSLRTSPELPRQGLVEARPRVLTATALFDGHDASIQLIRRELQARGAEVIHLGHHRSVREIVLAAIQEDVAAVAVSSYQGGHNEFFAYLREELDRAGGAHVLIFGGGGGVILPEEAAALERRGISKVFTVEDGRRLGLAGMAGHILDAAAAVAVRLPVPPAGCDSQSMAYLARLLSALEAGWSAARLLDALPASRRAGSSAVVGVTGPGGAGKSSLVDEIVRRLRSDVPELAVAVLSVDPTRRKTGGALLGDRLRMNAVYQDGVFLRSFATRGSGNELSQALRGALQLLARAGYPLALVETAGIGQGSSAIQELASVSLYVMTAEFGAPTQLEKIDMLDFADLVAVNKAERAGGEDAVATVARQLRRLGRHEAAARTFGTSAANFNDPGVERLYRALMDLLVERHGLAWSATSPPPSPAAPATSARLIPAGRENYLAEAARTVRRYRERTAAAVRSIREIDAARAARASLEAGPAAAGAAALEALEALIARLEGGLPDDARRLLEDWERDAKDLAEGRLRFSVRGRELEAPLSWRTISGTSLPRLALPRFTDRGELLRFLSLENLPGRFPYTAGVFPLRRQDEAPTRMFAGEGSPERTNRRFHLLSEGQAAKRLSVAFDSVTLYGQDPDERPDIFGKVGESGVSIATWEDMRRLFEGFDLCDPATSVSMTINGPAPAILAMFFTAAFEQQADRFRSETGREPDGEERARIRGRTLRGIRGTVQADILKEDQAQNTCLFSTPFALRLMGDVEEHFIQSGVENYYSVSVSGYHIAEAGANPITQLAFTLANGLTYLEHYAARGLDVDRFAKHFSFFFSMGMDPEYAVLGRVARRIWAIVLRDRYGAGERAQKLKYHVQTSGRSLHAREMAFNDIRTTLQALMAYQDQCNSLHTNAYDEAVTTPTPDSVRRALAIQLIIQKELGSARIDNALQGAYSIELLTEAVEDAVLAEFESISRRGGIPGAMESGYLRNKIQEESRLYEELKHEGKLEIVGVNTFVADGGSGGGGIPVSRASLEEKTLQIQRTREFRARHAGRAAVELERLKRAARAGENIFAVILDAVRCASLGQVTQALFEVGGEYRRMV